MFCLDNARSADFFNAELYCEYLLIDLGAKLLKTKVYPSKTKVFADFGAQNTLVLP